MATLVVTAVVDASNYGYNGYRVQGQAQPCGTQVKYVIQTVTELQTETVTETATGTETATETVEVTATETETATETVEVTATETVTSEPVTKTVNQLFTTTAVQKQFVTVAKGCGGGAAGGHGGGSGGYGSAIKFGGYSG
ncbi:hypothetical protein Hamer_G023792 [Homarus americanus]|uniref:Uncharacterized protein n=2 Tax=Homarus americanus TaxID=6706 RepID=A0A8J5NE55_HOMAM|nr:hypothetical protein Hamer_G023792 [Homarus americanus]